MVSFKHTTLANGLEVVAELNPHAQSCALGFFVRTGARDETPEESGVSHFLEHMVFKGTETYTADDVNRLFDDIGADYNASTGEETTTYYSAVLPEYFAQAFALQAAILRPALREADFAMEKNVILEEIGMYDDQPSYVAYDNVMSRHFANHPLGSRVLGTKESIAALGVEQMRAYFARRYTAGNITLAVAGALDWSEILRLAEVHCGNWPTGRPGRTWVTPQPAGGDWRIDREGQQMSQVMQLAPAPDGRDLLRFSAELLSVIVGDDTNSRLFWELVDCGEAEAAELSYSDFEDCGAWMTFLSTAPEQSQECLELIDAVYQQINRDGVTARELELAKNKVGSRVVLRGERPLSRLSHVGQNWLTHREYRSVADDLAIIERITLDDMRRLLALYPLAQTSTVRVGPAAVV